MNIMSTTGVLKELPWMTRYELIRGYKEGRFPAIVIGKGGRGSKLRWDLDLLQDAIRRQMLNDQEERRKAAQERDGGCF